MVKETIILEDLSIGYQSNKQSRVVAEGINASLYDSELTCLIGANGVGKSTLLRTLSAFQPPLSGKIILQDKSLSDYSSHELAREIGVVLTTKPEVENLTIQEMVGLGRSPYTGFWGKLSTDDKKIVDEAIHQANIDHLRDRMIQTLSDGERQKVMIAKALAQQTPVIFLDEPTAFLDFPSKVDTLQMLRRLAHELHKTIFLSTHDVELAFQLADKLWVMESKDEGQHQIFIGTPRKLADNGTLTRFVERKGIAFDKASLTINVIAQ